ncbi:type II secretion system protein [Patescibacteria group bacterium]
MEKNKLGFTLLELLIVMAILGILAVVIFVIINPAEMLARSRDTGRINAVTQMGRAVQHYRTTHDNTYPDELGWGADLTTSAEINTIPAGIAYNMSGTSNCTTNPLPALTPSFCYDLDGVGGNGALVFSRLESNLKNEYCTPPEVSYFVFSTADSRGGLICSVGDPTPWATGTVVYVE